jgi:hypothetical protein
VKWAVTIPTLEAAQWMYDQEKRMFNPGAQITLPGTTSLLDISYDDLTDTVTTIDAGNETNFRGLIRTSTSVVPAGAFTKVARGSGIELISRSTTNIGVDVTIPATNVRDDLERADETARRARFGQVFSYVGGFTANVTINSNSLTSVANLTVPSTVNLRGATVTGTGIPASTVITDVVGATVYLSKVATATNNGVNITFKDFPLPVGYEAQKVNSDGVNKREGSGKDWTRSFDGFVEKEIYATEPGVTAWVQIEARAQQSS